MVYEKRRRAGDNADELRFLHYNIKLLHWNLLSLREITPLITLSLMYNSIFIYLFVSIYYFDLDVYFSSYSICSKVKDCSFTRVHVFFPGGLWSRLIKRLSFFSCCKLSSLYLPLKTHYRSTSSVNPPLLYPSWHYFAHFTYLSVNCSLCTAYTVYTV